jgi:hypothetical protein
VPLDLPANGVPANGWVSPATTKRERKEGTVFPVQRALFTV